VNTPIVLIAGALTGIGRATALAFANEGARLVVSGRKEAGVEALEPELRKLGAEAEFVVADVRHETDVRNLVDSAVARFGRLDVAVNCQRIALEEDALVDMENQILKPAPFFVPRWVTGLSSSA
jgi:NAD(P)-dependent dehydrogenase (short-subunit alcohol dehydrogenase family)